MATRRRTQKQQVINSENRVDIGVNTNDNINIDINKQQKKKKKLVYQDEKKDGVGNGVEEKGKEKTKTKTKTEVEVEMEMTSILRSQPVWILLAVGSGACAAVNGVFAKLTTTSLTSTLSSHLAVLLGLSADNTTVNLVLRGTFFALNLLFNAVMWGLFTAALTKGSSTTRVSIVNVSTNFLVTAFLGWAVFGEELGLRWWGGAFLLGCGNIVIGRREEGEGAIKLEGDVPEEREEEQVRFEDGREEVVRLVDEEEGKRVRQGEDIDAPV